MCVEYWRVPFCFGGPTPRETETLSRSHCNANPLPARKGIPGAPAPPPGSYNKAREVARELGNCLGTSGTSAPEAASTPPGNSETAMETFGRSRNAREADGNIFE